MSHDDPLPTLSHAADLEASVHPSASRPPPGQFGTFALLGAAIGTVPLPWIPDALARRLRGALVQDVAARHGLALTSEARLVLAEPTATKSRRGPLAQAFGYISKKFLVRLGPLALLLPLRSALETYVLGYLFDRDLARAARSGESRIEAEEARVVRSAIERAVLRVASMDGQAEWPSTPVPPEESRDEITKALDGLLIAATTIPSWLLRRLDAAFDDALARP